MQTVKHTRRPATLLAGLVAACGIYGYAVSSEPATGGLRGEVRSAATGEPLAGLEVVAQPLWEQPQFAAEWETGLAEPPPARRATTDEAGRFSIPRLYAGAYEVYALANAHGRGSWIAFVKEGETAEAPLDLQPDAPYLRLYVHDRAVLPGREARLAAHGFRQGGELQLEVLSFDSAALVREHGGNLRELLTPVGATGTTHQLPTLENPDLRPVKQWEYRVVNRDREGVFYDRISLGELESGGYLVRARGEHSEALGWLIVTDLALVTKTSPGELLAFAADLKTGKPVADTELSLFRGSRSLAGARTDSRGVAEIRLPPDADDRVTLVARRGESLAFVRLWGADAAADEPRVTVYTERPVYRPGHRVHFKGVMRLPEGSGYAVPAARRLTVTVTDQQDTVFHREEVTLTERGSFAGEFTLPRAAAGGNYWITTGEGDSRRHAGEFVVASYRKPEWEVEVEIPRQPYVFGDRLPVTVRAEYFFGAPVVGAQVQYTVMRTPHWGWWDESDDPYFDDYGGTYGEIVEEGEATLGADGSARLTVPTARGPDDRANEYRYSLSVHVSDASGRWASGEGSVRVRAGEISVNARSSRSVATPGDEVEVVARVRDMDDRPLAGITVTAGSELLVWERGREHRQRLATRTAVSDADGLARFPFQASNAGLVQVTASARDRRGNRVESVTSVWVTTHGGGAYYGDYPELAVIPDKQLYQVGDAADVLINTDRPGATAIVAIEAERVLEYRLVELEQRSTLVRFEVQEGWEPNVFVTVCFVSDTRFSRSQARLDVDAAAHRLAVEIESDREVYRPGETATFRVRATGPDGRPARAELSFALVDEALYSIRADRPGRLWEAFYPRRWLQVSTQFAYPPVYLGGDGKDGTDVSVRREFPDTAHWEPFLLTDENGEATVRVRLPDSLTSWRATVHGHTAATEIGEARHNVRVTQELIVRLQTPRTFTEGDRLTVTAVAHNYTESAVDATVELAARGVEVQGNASQRVRLPAGEAGRVAWTVTAAHAGDAVLTATARAGAHADGMELTVPVLPFARPRTLYRTGALGNGEASEEFGRTEGTEGELELRLSPTLAGPILSALDYLVAFPYGCTEQTISSFMPDVAVLQLLREQRLDRPELAERVPEMTEAGLLRLYQFQNPDGGWGWFGTDGSDPWLTGYVLLGILLAREAGERVNFEIYRSGLNRAMEMAQEADLDRDDAMLLAYVLMRAQQPQAARAALRRLDGAEERLQVRSLGYAMLALAASSRPEERQRGRELLAGLWERAHLSGGLASWSERRDPDRYVSAPQDVESTAVVLKAALALTPDDPRLAGVVRWLLQQRRGDRWISTRDTAWILLALVDYLRVTGELAGDYRLTVLLNGEEVHAEQVTAAGGFTEERVLHLPVDRLQANNRLELRKEGEGVAYYALTLTELLRAEAFQPESSHPGLSLERAYYRLETRRGPGGQSVVAPTGRPAERFSAGDRLLVRLTVRTDRPLEFMMLEEPLPAGFEAQERGVIDRWDWRYWWTSIDVRDDRIVFFIRDLPPGEHVVEYYVRAEMAGRLRVRPALLSDMYVPSTFAATGDATLEVRR